MALASAIDIFALHGVSKQLSSDIKGGSTGSSARACTLWPIPTSATASLKNVKPVIPSQTIFEGLYEKDSNAHLPSAAACAVHLEFLAALRSIRDCVLESEDLDEVFDTKLTKKKVTRKGVEVELKDDTLKERRQVKWEKYVELAVVRFLAWLKTVPDIVTGGKDNPVLLETALPPLDVLMVWHSFLLNPRWFRRTCEDGRNVFYKLEFPWAAIHQRLQSDWSFSLTPQSSLAFEKGVSLISDLFEALSTWKTYPQDILKRLVFSTRHSLSQEELEVLPNFLKLSTWDQHLLERCVVTKHSVGEDLKQAVLRQASFVDKMWEKLWISSPALDGTVRRASHRYNNFLRLYKLYPTTMFVPTLDIDLVWHTHQCSPSKYYVTTQGLAGKFINHDDSIIQAKLDTGFEETKNLYRIRFGKEYQICGCWDCEMLQSAIEKAGKHANLGQIAQRVGADVAYYRAIEVARRTKKPIPVK